MTEAQRPPAPLAEGKKEGQSSKAGKTAPTRAHSSLKLLIELAPLALFFVVYARWDIYVATAVLMAATVASLAASRILLGKITLLPLITGAFVMVFGGLALYFSNETFIKVKPTVVYLCMATPLLGGLLFGKSLLAHVLGEALELDAAGWRTLTLRWGLFFVLLAVLNEIVWRNFSTATWVTLKSFGFIPLTLLFALSQTPLVMRHTLRDDADKPGDT